MFSIETEVDRERRELLRARLRETNTAASPAMRALRDTPAERELPLHLWAVDETGAMGGGLVGHIWATWFHVDLLWVDAAHRDQGLGSRLLREAEETARVHHGCVRARVETWDFQAPDFYRRHGYEVVGVVPDYPPGITEFTLAKRLAPVGAGG